MSDDWSANFEIIHHHERCPVPSFNPRFRQCRTSHHFTRRRVPVCTGRPHRARSVPEQADEKICVYKSRKPLIRVFPGDYQSSERVTRVLQKPRPFRNQDGKTKIFSWAGSSRAKGAMYLLQEYAKDQEKYNRHATDNLNWGPQMGKRGASSRQAHEDVLVAGRVEESTRRVSINADIFCAPSTGQESFGIVLLEAMAAGLPVVASDIHGYKRVVQRNVSGLLVEPKDPDAIAAALERLICDPALRVRLGEAGARRAPEFDWSHVTAQLVGVYEEVIQRRRASVRVS